MKTRLLFLLSALLGYIASYAFTLESKPSETITPVRTIEQDATGITVSYKFSGAISLTDDLYPECKSIDIPGFGHNLTLGEPAWPIRIDSFEIPDGCEAEVSILSDEWIDLGMTLAPARPLLIDSSDETYSLENVPTVKKFDGIKPTRPVDISDIQTYRDRSILYVNVIPVKCIGNFKTMVCENLTYRVSFKSTRNGLFNKSEKIIHEVDKDLMKTMYTTCLPESDIEVQSSLGGTKWVNAPYYLILSSPNYKSSVNNFVEWKKCMGFNTDVIYSSSWTSEKIKETISKAYNAASTLQYVLLIGDAKLLPPVRHLAIESRSSYDHSSDFTYGCMDGDDDLEQDVIIGRLSVTNASEASIVINKIIDYEKNPTLNSSFHLNAIQAAYFQDQQYPNNYEDRRFTRTSEDIRNGLNNEDFFIKRIYNAYNSVTPTNWNKGTYAYGESLPEELLKPNFKWNGSTSDVINAINSGAFYVLHRGHGSYNGWSLPSLTINDVTSLNNRNLLPVFFNINCQSGAFGYTEISGSGNNIIDKSFSEALLRKANGGAVGIIAASEVS